jgi:hypothetical protein
MRKVRCGKVFAPVRFAFLVALGAAIGAPCVLSSQIAPDRKAGSLGAVAVESERFVLNPAIEELEGARSRLAPAVDAAWSAFRLEHGAWVGYLDLRSGRLESAEGEGIPWIPGSGNRLDAATVGIVDLAALEGIARRFVAEQEPLLGLDGKDLVLSSGRSGAVSDSLWYVDFDVRRAGIPIEGARVVFRVNHGNLIQFGLESVPPAGVAVPKVAISAEQAGKKVAERVGGLVPGRDEILDPGSLHLLPSAENDARFVEGFAYGEGYGLTAVWDLTFRRAGDLGTWRARVDATTGELLSLADVNRYAQATGGVVQSAPSAPDVVRAMPWADLSNVAFTNSNGRFDFSGTPLTSTLDGQFVNVLDTCGAISAGTGGPSGNLSFGSSASGTNCATPGFGGAGNTRSARTSFFWVNRAKEIARGWLPSVNWLFFTLRTNVNLSQTCNAYWSGSTLNFFKSGGGCNNSGELPGVAIHELGHGLDANDGNGESGERASGESNGDLLAALVLHKSCIGEGFRSTACTGSGDACTACTGVRDIDWARHTSNAPHTVANFVQPSCPAPEGYPGPCGREGHCESYVPSEAVWDFVNRDLPNQNLGGAAAWNLMERLWFVSRSTATKSFTCNTGTSTWSSSGCNVGSLWKALRAADDDDGNLANGTPHGAALFIAFNRHGMACISDPGTAVTFAACTPPPAPPLTLTPDDEKVKLSWGAPSGGAVYDVYRNDVGCDAGFVRISKNSSLSSGQDLTVVNGQTYFYQVVGHASGNEACASAPSPCRSVVPNVPQLPFCNPPDVPTGLTATAISPSEIDLSWNAATGAIRYRVFVGFSATGPFTDYGTTTGTTFRNTGTLCNVAHYYFVRAEKADTCVSANSATVTATTLPCPPCHKTILYSNDFETGTGLADWVRGSFAGRPDSWRGIQSCAAASGAGIFRFGGLSCTDDYGIGAYSYAQPNGIAGIGIPYGSKAPRLTFSHRRAFEAGMDGALLSVSIDGGPYAPVPASAITSGGYDGTIGSSCAPEGTLDLPVWTGSSAGFTDTAVDLSGLCGDLRGCGGHTLGLAFTAITDCAGTDDGWFLDDVAVSACVP